MKLTEFLLGSLGRIQNTSGQNETAGVTEASAEKIMQQIKSLIPGSMLSGEILSKNGNEVKVKLLNELIMNAKLEQDVNVEEGQILTFEVKNNGKSLYLSPLYANTSSSDNVYKALEAAKLPVNERTITMTEGMMQHGMSIDSKSLQSMFKDITVHMDTEVLNIIDLHRLGLEITKENISQIEQYKALKHQITDGVKEVFDNLQAVYLQTEESQITTDGVKLYQELLQIFVPDVEADVEAKEPLLLKEMFAGQVAGPEAEAQALPIEREQTVQNLVRLLKDGTEIKSVIKELAKTPILLPEVRNTLSDLFKTSEFKNALTDYMLDMWSIDEAEDLDGKKVEELYTKLNRELKEMGDVLQNHGLSETAAGKSVANLSQNIDFMNQINQLYTYIQIPLKMYNGHKNSDLYVFTNKRNLASKDGNISALLHLDMAHLGPVDVYVAMMQQNVTTRFTVRDDEVLDFLNERMDLLTERLSKRGYSLKCEMSLKTDEESENPIDHILSADSKNTVLAQYGFDVRA